MNSLSITPCTYQPGELTYASFIRGERGWSHHQGPSICQYSDGRVFMCWGAYDIEECSNDGVMLYSHSYDRGESWDVPEVWMAAPNSIVSHVQLRQVNGTERAIMVYREGHYFGAQSDRRLRTNLKWANYAESPNHLLTRISHDGGTVWEPAIEISPEVVVDDFEPPYYGAPEHMIQLASGRMLLFVGYMHPRRRQPQHFHVAVLKSDDQCTTWQKAWDLTVDEERGAMEPSVAETSPGTLYGVLRNKSGYIYEFHSKDGGDNWTEPLKTTIPTPESMAKVIGLASGRLLLVWNNQSSKTQQPRHPLVAALSDDDGASWSAPKTIADDIGGNQLSNFNITQLDDGRIILCTSHYRPIPPSVSNLDLALFDETWLVQG